jgi:hypothetical protein
VTERSGYELSFWLKAKHSLRLDVEPSGMSFNLKPGRYLIEIPREGLTGSDGLEVEHWDGGVVLWTWFADIWLFEEDKELPTEIWGPTTDPTRDAMREHLKVYEAMRPPYEWPHHSRRRKEK